MTTRLAMVDTTAAPLAKDTIGGLLCRSWDVLGGWVVVVVDVEVQCAHARNVFISVVGKRWSCSLGLLLFNCFDLHRCCFHIFRWNKQGIDRALCGDLAVPFGTVDFDVLEVVVTEDDAPLLLVVDTFFLSSDRQQPLQTLSMCGVGVLGINDGAGMQESLKSGARSPDPIAQATVGHRFSVKKKQRPKLQVPFRVKTNF